MKALGFKRPDVFARSIFVAVASVLTLAGATIAHAGPGLSGGNAGVVINGRFHTLPEAGLKSVDAKDPITPQMIRKSTESVELLMTFEAPLGRNNKASVFVGKMFGSDREYVEVKVVDPKLFAKIKAEYQPFVDQVGKGSFGLAAFTHGRTTYLLPQFFSSTIETQARVLIHEQIYSLTWNQESDRPGIQLKNLLRFDIALFNVMESMPKSQCVTSSASCGVAAWQMIYALHKLDLPGFEVTRKEAAAHALGMMVYSQLGKRGTITLALNRPLADEDLGILMSLLGREVSDVFTGSRLEFIQQANPYDGGDWVTRDDKSFELSAPDGVWASYDLDVDPITNRYSCLGTGHRNSRRLCVR